LANRLLFGPLNPHIQHIYSSIDVTKREFVVILPLIVGTLVMGIYPDIFLNNIHSSSALIIQHSVSM
jgi:NADH-ubiquinone oxidoreductase chain 4